MVDFATLKQKMQRGDMKVVLDGGALLHRVQWTKGTTFSEITNNYLGHIRNLVGNTIDKDDVNIVFDGYLTSSTKDHCHLKRCPLKSMKQLVEPGKKLETKKQVFLANSENKQDFISMLSESLRGVGYNVLECQRDADLEIVKSSIDALAQKPVVMIGDDTDLLVLSMFYINEIESDENLFMMRLSSETVIDIQHVVREQPIHIVNNILTIHAMSGCDTVSALAGIGKKSLIKTAAQDVEMNDDLQAFMAPDVDKDTLSTSGQNILSKLYLTGKKKNVAFDQLRIM